MGKTAVIGIGNALRGDDAVGLVIADRLKSQVNPTITILNQDGNITQLLESFAEFQLIYLIDAISLPTAALGSIHRIDGLHDTFAERGLQSSSHAVDIGQAIELARILDQIPQQLIIYGITGGDFTLSRPLSTPVQAAIPKLITQLLNELKQNEV